MLLPLVYCAFAILGATPVRAGELRQIARYQIDGTFHNVTSFAVDRQGNLLVVDHDGPAVIRVGPTGKRIASYSQSGNSYCQISGPTSVAQTGDGFVLFDFRRQHLLRFDLGGECQSDDLARTFQASSLALSGTRIVGAGSLMRKVPGQRCVFFSTDFAGSPGSATCLLNITNDKLWLLYGRQFVDYSLMKAYYMTPYEPVLYTSNGTTAAHAVALQGLGIPPAALPSNEEQIRMDRARFYDFYNGQTVIEGVAATSKGVVVAVRTPGSEHRVDLRYFSDGSTTSSAAASLTMAPVTGAYPVHIRGNGGDLVYVLIAKGKYPSIRYDVVVYQIR